MKKFEEIKQPTVCVISLTFNRPEYIERSFKSLYKRAGCQFDHFVFDDHSDEETEEMLFGLKKKYGFNLFINNKRMGIYKSFYWNLKYIPLDYDYYVKLDSDIEILSSNLFVEMIENFKYPDKIGGATPRSEGIINVDRYSAPIQFYGGHAIKVEAPIIYGCCMMFPNIMFRTFKRLEGKELENTVEKWGIDSILYDHAKRIGKFLIIEDLSVYHIDNTYGQRKNNDGYFTDRKRWSKIDNDEVWCMKASKSLYPMFFERSAFDKIRNFSSTFEEFLENCLVYAKSKKVFGEKIVEKQKEEKVEIKKQPIYMKTMYKVTSPSNFRQDPNMIQGESKLFAEVPEWAKNNPRLVVEKVEVEDDFVEELDELEEQGDQDTETEKAEVEEENETEDSEKEETTEEETKEQDAEEQKEENTEETGETTNTEETQEEVKEQTVEETKEEKPEEIKENDESRKTTENEENKKNEKGKIIRKCKYCDYTTTSLRRLKKHQEKKHG
ncbi:MAG: glycosyltransferase family A protein [Methanogenium sp.]|jgi:glycosyltransferase involved in cell wall biosynthesis